MIVSYIKKVISLLQSCRPVTYRYRLAGLDLPAQLVTLHVVCKNLFVKHTFSDIIANAEIIDGLSCQHACWIGVYYGQALRQMLTGQNYLLKHKRGQYKIISEYRDGSIEYLDVKNRTTLKKHPMVIAEDGALIQQFDPSQACYIGILAGIALQKKQNSVQYVIPENAIPYLRLVK